LKLNIDDVVRADVPNEIKELIEVCSRYDREDRLDFIEVMYLSHLE
jgi:hypothetical protein